MAGNTITQEETFAKKHQTYPSWLGWFLFVLACALYANTIKHQYAFDDSIVIVGNTFTQKGFAGIYELCTRDFFDGIYGNEKMNLAGGRYRPLSLVMFAIEYQFFGANPLVGHCINILLYGLTAVVIFNLLKKYYDQPEESGINRHQGAVIGFISAFLFVLFPVHTEVVANIKSRDEILALLLSLSTLLCLDKAVRNPSNVVAYIMGLVTFFLAMLAKENAFVFTVLIPISLYTVYYLPVDRVLKLTFPFVLVGIGYFMLRQALVGGFSGVENPDIMENPFYGVAFGQKFGTIGVILLKYLQVLIAPFTLSCDYSYNQIPYVGLSNPVSILGWGIYAIMGGIGVWSIYKKSLYGYGIFLYILPLGLTTNILFNIGAPMGERFVYMPSLGLAICAAVGLVKLGKVESWAALSKKPLIMLILLSLGGLYAFKTVKRNPDWYNNETLFEADIKNAPNSAKMRYYYANTVFQKYLDDPENPKNKPYLDKAEQQFMKAVEINPKFHTALYNLGNVHWNKGNGQLAEKYLKMVLEMQPTHMTSTELLGKVYARYLNQPAKAIEYLEKAINTFQRKSADNYGSLGIAYAMSGNLDKGIELVKVGLGVEPESFVLWQNLAALYAQKGDTAEAERCMQQSKMFQAKKQKK